MGSMTDERPYRLGESDEDYGSDYRDLLSRGRPRTGIEIGVRFHPSAVVVCSDRPDPSFGIRFPEDGS